VALRKNKTIIITGAANGLGKAFSHEFFRRGYDLALIDVDEENLKVVQTCFLAQNKK
jgi:short-subunit dehydrogenase